MRVKLTVTAAALALTALTALASRASAQRAGADSFPPPLSLDDRVDLVNSVLEGRQYLFGQPVLVDGCALSKAVGVAGENMVPMVSAEFRMRVQGKPGNCINGFGSARESNLVVLEFRRITHELAEYIPVVGPNSPRPTNLMVVRVSVHDQNQGSRIEDWVMAPARPHHWRVVTVRVFMIGAV